MVLILFLEYRKQVWHFLYHHRRSGEVRGLHKLRHAKKSETLTISHVSVVTSFVKSITSSWVGWGEWRDVKLVNGFAENFRHTFLSLYFVAGLASTHFFFFKWKPYSFLSIFLKKCWENKTIALRNQFVGEGWDNTNYHKKLPPICILYSTYPLAARSSGKV